MSGCYTLFFYYIGAHLVLWRESIHYILCVRMATSTRSFYWYQQYSHHPVPKDCPPMINCSFGGPSRVSPVSSTLSRHANSPSSSPIEEQEAACTTAETKKNDPGNVDLTAFCMDDGDGDDNPSHRAASPLLLIQWPIDLAWSMNNKERLRSPCNTITGLVVGLFAKWVFTNWRHVHRH